MIFEFSVVGTQPDEIPWGKHIGVEHSWQWAAETAVGPHDFLSFKNSDLRSFNGKTLGQVLDGIFDEGIKIRRW